MTVPAKPSTSPAAGAPVKSIARLMSLTVLFFIGACGEKDVDKDIGFGEETPPAVSPSPSIDPPGTSNPTENGSKDISGPKDEPKKISVAKTLPPATVPPPPDGSVGTLRVTVDPPGTRVELYGGSLTEPRTLDENATITLPPGTYRWRATRPGYRADSSGSLGLVITAGSKLEHRLSLMAIGGNMDALKSARERYAAGDCASAIRLYEQLPAPTDSSGEVAVDWAKSRLELGQCHRKLGYTDNADDALKSAMAVAPTMWEARFELAMTICESRSDFKVGREIASEMRGTYSNLIPSPDKLVMRAMAQYANAACYHEEYKVKQDQSRFDDLRELTVAELNDFLDSVERLQGVVPPQSALMRRVSGVAKEAERRLAELAS